MKQCHTEPARRELQATNGNKFCKSLTLSKDENVFPIKIMKRDS